MLRRRVGVDAVDVVALSRGDLERWRELAVRAVVPNPFFEPEHVLPLVTSLGQESSVALLVLRVGNDWHGCLPIHRVARWHRVPLRSVVTWRGSYLDTPLLGTPLIASERPAESLRMLVDGMRRLDRSASFAALEVVAEDRGFGELISEAVDGLAPTAVVFSRFERAALSRKAEQSWLEERLAATRRRSLGRQRRKLDDAFESIQVLNCAGDEAALDRLINLEAAGWKGRQGTAVAMRPRHAGFFREMCRGFAEQDRLQIFELRGANQTIASKCNLLGGDTVFLLKEAYDESWASYSPGTLLEVEMLERFYDAPGAAFIDSCASHDNQVFNRLLPDRRPIATIAVPAPGLAGEAARLVLAGAGALRQRRRERLKQRGERRSRSQPRLNR
jgi:CelD/BcsL family acetyltransferase involved in cellulose biosynthesis